MVADRSVRIDITAEYELANVESAVENLASGKTRGKKILSIILRSFCDAAGPGASPTSEGIEMPTVPA
ncbi:hypothetical protein WEI85_46990 [Actinomycetes bacterium KLBMP 9797]